MSLLKYILSVAFLSATIIFAQEDSSPAIISTIDSLKKHSEEYQYFNSRIYYLEKELEKKSEEVDTLKARLNEIISRQKEINAMVSKGWRKLKMYMTIAEVKKLLGEPRAISKTMSHTKYWYGNGFVEFNSYKALCEWTEPRIERIENIEY